MGSTRPARPRGPGAGGAAGPARGAAWRSTLATVVVAFGAALVVASWMPIGFGSLKYVSCTQGCATPFWQSVFDSQAVLLFGWPVPAIALAIAARWTRAAWLGVALVAAAVTAIALVPFLAGRDNPSPSIAGVSLPAVSPAFEGWLPAALTLFAGALLQLSVPPRPKPVGVWQR
jgi:hypothetical protein